ncbi:hypothetical protein PIIN_00735 [Serendipita indica DSM 11827]|uniref:Bacteriophage T5 Orf172 DNA-binding domain-containing protein n=1 Tax=Serendipita indica (strain DSM 11827) TaxID=1109443 RepID=G4T6H7_SERID|nr:hypothetical protein PIIN_00735 [Serendipita indica DSM 11827]
MADSRKPPAFPVPRTNAPQVDDLADKMQNMRFAPPNYPPSGWTGGFNPQQLPLSELSKHDPYLAANQRPAFNKPLPPAPPNNYPAPSAPPGGLYPALPPPSMPTPEPFQPSKSDSSLPVRKGTRRTSYPIPLSPSIDAPPSLPSSSKPRPTRRRTGSDDGDGIQCAGITKAGKRCTRKVKAAPPFSSNLDPLESDEGVERFCFQHTKEILSQTGFFPSKPLSAMVSFDTWISDELQEDTRVALRAEMEKPVSAADNVDGYIYCYQIINVDTPNHVHLKVGRSNNFVSRVGQWEKQCRSKQLVLRGCWPFDPNSSNLKGKMQQGEKGPHVNRLERLIHLELADIAKNAPYLRPGWPGPTTGPDVGTSKKKKKEPDVSLSGKPCPDCSRVHKEIFTFVKATGELENAEWQKIVLPVIEKWGHFVQDYL